MGYGSYDTPLGTAGYNVEDTCHAEGCTAAIDRGLSYLCGDQPGRVSEYGCGRWFCGRHLYSPGPDIDVAPGSGLCPTCITRVDVDDPDDDPAGTLDDGGCTVHRIRGHAGEWIATPIFSCPTCQ